MTDSLLTDADIEETLSRVYVQAVAARAGYVISEPRPDRTGIDLRVEAGGAMAPAIDLQLKATVNLGGPRNGRYHYNLNSTNYNKLCRLSQVPRLLIVLDLPDEKDLWVTVTSEELVLRRKALWLNLRGREETDNRYSVTVHIPEQNLLDIDNLRMLMDQSRKGKLQ